jgi:hypothetical protein
VEIMKREPTLTVREAAVRLNLPDYERSSEPGSEDRAEKAAERKLQRWIALLKKLRSRGQ